MKPVDTYKRVTEVRRMCEVIARTLGHTTPDFHVEFDMIRDYSDKTIRIHDRGYFMTLHAPNEQGRMVKAFEVGGLLCNGDYEAMERVASHIQALYIACQFAESRFYLKPYAHVPGSWRSTDS